MLSHSKDYGKTNQRTIEKIATRAYLESIPQIENFALQTDDNLCVLHSVNNLVQLSPFIREKPVYTLELFQESCKRFFKRTYSYRHTAQCDGTNGFSIYVVKEALEPDLNFLEFEVE